MITPARHLLFHASIVLLIGLVCGAPYGKAIIKQKSENIIRAWKLAHGALSLGATTLIAIAAVMSSLQVSQIFQWAIAISAIVSGYSFCFALILEPFVQGEGLNSRGLAWLGSPLNKTVFVGNVAGAGSSLVSAIALVIASFVSL